MMSHIGSRALRKTRKTHRGRLHGPGSYLARSFSRKVEVGSGFGVQDLELVQRSG